MFCTANCVFLVKTTTYGRLMKEKGLITNYQNLQLQEPINVP